MMKNLIPTLAAAFIAVAPARADSVKVVMASDATPGTVAIEVYRGKEKIWNTALHCDTIRTMGPARLQNMIRAYAQDAYEDMNGHWEAAHFEKQLQGSVSEPVRMAAFNCTYR